METELGWVQHWNFDTGMEQTIAWYLENREWWTNILSGAYRNYFEEMYGQRLE